MSNPVRMVLAVASATVLVAALGTLTWRDLAAPELELMPVDPLVVQVDSGSARVVCPGQLASPTEDATGGDLIYDPDFDTRPTSVTAQSLGLIGGSSGGQSWLIGSEQRSELAGPLDLVDTSVDQAPLVLEALSTVDTSAITGGGVLIDSADGDSRGLAGSSCLAPTADAYILGGSTEVGASSRLILVNPGATAVSVDLKLWGPGGPVEAIGATGMTLPPNSQRAIRLEGLIGDASGLGLRITASGGEIVSYLQHTRTDGLISAGVDFAVPGAPPSTQLALGAIISEKTTLDTTDPTILRLLAPGSKDAKVSVKIYGPTGQLDLPATEDLTLAAGEVNDVPLLGLEAGTYAALISSDEPVLAAAMSTRFGSSPSDPREIAWSAGGLPPGSGYLPVMSPETRIVITAEAELRLTYRLYGIDADVGQAQVKDIAPGQTAVLSSAELGAGSSMVGLSYSLDTAGPVALAAVVSDKAGTKISVMGPTDTMAVARTVAVSPQQP